REGLAGMKTEPVSASVPSGTALPTPSRSTGVLAAVPRGRRWGVAVAGSLLAALLRGAGLGVWYRARDAATEEAPAPANGKAEGFFSSQREKEKFFLDALKLFANPGARDELEMGLDHRLALGLIYLNQWRLDDAEKFFGELVNNSYKVPAYIQLGRVGQGI